MMLLKWFLFFILFSFFIVFWAILLKETVILNDGEITVLLLLLPSIFFIANISLKIAIKFTEKLDKKLLKCYNYLKEKI